MSVVKDTSVYMSFHCLKVILLGCLKGVNDVDWELVRSLMTAAKMGFASYWKSADSSSLNDWHRRTGSIALLSKLTYFKRIENYALAENLLGKLNICCLNKYKQDDVEIRGSD